MTPILKLILGGTLIIVVSIAVIVPTVVTLTKKQTNANTTSAPTPLSSTLSTVSSASTGRPTSNLTSTTGLGTASSTSRLTTATIRANTTTLTTTRVTTTTTANTSLFSAIYSSALTTASERFDLGLDPAMPWFYYEAVLLNITSSGPYQVFSRSNIDTFGYIFEEIFDPRFGLSGVIASDDEGGGNNQFLVTSPLLAGRTYIVVLTTYERNVTGAFSIVVTGPGPITITRLNTTASLNPIMQTNISSVLTNSSAKFCRYPTCPTLNYNYQAFAINVTTTGGYDIRTQSNIDTFGHLYNSTFNPLNSMQNLLLTDDDLAGQSQFRIATLLRVGVRYIIVVTTWGTNVIGSFTLIVRGVGNCTITPIAP